MAFEFITVGREGPITIVTLNRPQVLNCLHAPMHHELHAAFDGFAADPEQWICILTGAGERAFSAGSDLKAIAAGGSIPLPPSGYAGLAGRYDLNKPVIAAVNGLAMGGGFEIALACDLLIADSRAVFALPEPRVGVVATGGGMLRLPRQIGLKRALDIILTGRRVGAEEGLNFGFVNEVAPAGEVMTVARRWAGLILEVSPLAVRASKEGVLKGLEYDTLDAAFKMQKSYPAIRALYESEDYREGPRAFAEKRPPVWKGR